LIEISDKTVDPHSLEGAYPQNSLEWSIAEKMSGSQETYNFNSIDQLKFELDMRKSTVDAAIALDHSGMDFAIFRKSECNPDCWDRDDNGGFTLKNGVKPSAAISDIFQNGQEYATECATAIVIVFYKAVLAVFPEALFDKEFSEITLMNWHRVEPVFRGDVMFKNVKDYFPGDRRYFKNPDVSSEKPEWQGENVVMLDTDSYYGHGLGIYDGEEIIKDLNENRKEDPEKPAYLMEWSSWPDYKKLWEMRKGYNP
jgi:protein-glutamine gamma-glutamyltransferase